MMEGMRFRLRDILGLVAVLAVAIGWWADTIRLRREVWTTEEELRAIGSQLHDAQISERVATQRAKRAEGCVLEILARTNPDIVLPTKSTGLLDSGVPPPEQGGGLDIPLRLRP
jgi:hypothetical protein